MEQLVPFVLFILLLVASTVFSKKAEEAQKKDQEKHGETPAPRGGTTQGELPRAGTYGGDMPDPTSPTYEDIPFEEVDLGTGRRVTLHSDDLAREMLEDNAHLAKHLAELDRWNSHSR